MKAKTGLPAKLLYHTDEFVACKGLDKRGRKHETVNHSKAEFVQYDGTKKIAANGCGSSFGSLKANVVGVHRHLSVKHLPAHLNEQAGKRNSRELDTIEQIAYQAGSMVGKRIKFHELTARTPEQEEGYLEREYEKFGLLQACLEAAGF